MEKYLTLDTLQNWSSSCQVPQLLFRNVSLKEPLFILGCVVKVFFWGRDRGGFDSFHMNPFRYFASV